MNVTPNTEERIVAAMAKGAVLTFHMRGGAGWDGWEEWVEKITLEHNGQHLTLSTQYRRDEYHFVPLSEDGEHWLRHREGSGAVPSASDIAYVIIERGDVREEYAGYRSDYATRWQEIYAHKSMPVPRWVTEQWDTPVSGYGTEW